MQGRISREVLREYLGGEHEVPGLAAVLGGVLGNDIIAAVSGKGAPSNNIVGLSMSGGLVVREMRAGQ